MPAAAATDGKGLLQIAAISLVHRCQEGVVDALLPLLCRSFDSQISRYLRARAERSISPVWLRTWLKYFFASAYLPLSSALRPFSNSSTSGTLRLGLTPLPSFEVRTSSLSFSSTSSGLVLNLLSKLGDRSTLGVSLEIGNLLGFPTLRHEFLFGLLLAQLDEYLLCNGFQSIENADPLRCDADKGRLALEVEHPVHLINRHDGR